MLLCDVNKLHYFQDELFNRIDEYAACKDARVIFFNSIGYAYGQLGWRELLE